MSIRLIQYAGQNVSPENDGAVYNALARGTNSTLTSMTMAVNEAGKIAFSDGYMLIQGRVLQFESHTITPTLASSGTQTGTIYVEIDITNQDAPAQIKTTMDTFVPVQGDINLGGSLYQLAIGTYQATTTAAIQESVVSALPELADSMLKVGVKNSATGVGTIEAIANGARINEKNNAGDLRVSLYTDDYVSRLQLIDANGKEGANLYTNTSGGRLQLKKNNENVIALNADTAEVTLNATTKQNGEMQIGNENNKFYADSSNNLVAKTPKTLKLGGGDVDSNNYAKGVSFIAGEAIVISNQTRIAAGQEVVRIAYDGDGGRIVVYNRSGDERVRIGITGSGAGKIEILDADGNARHL